MPPLKHFSVETSYVFCIFIRNYCFLGYLQYNYCLRGEEIISAVKILMLVFLVVTLYEFVGRYQRFGGTCCLHPQG
jgi:hypothetical protein